VQTISGLEKYPIQYWNKPGEKEGLELKEINVATFFYKSAYRVLESQRLLGNTESDRKNSSTSGATPG